VAELAAALNDDRVRAELVALEQAPHGGARRRGLGNGARVLMGAAAAAIIVAVTVPRMSRRDVPAYRDENGTAIAGPAIRHPSGPNSTSEFQWSSVPQAEQYRVTVFTDDGAIAWESTTADTTIALPARSPLESGRRYLWKVEARTGFDRWVGSRLVEFTLRDSVKR
ncbi:MAG TPA: hypothetical protein VE967_10485, partial [Gemmatimonadaceae bacterium]|nr:hypothetical protein [Gemmatimonadaceae bacterium]